MVEDIVASGALGELRFADFTYLSSQKPDNLRWRGSPGYAGGSVLDSGVHFIALLRKIVGEIQEVSASVSQRVPYLPPADSVTAILSFASGAEGAYRLTFAAPSPAGDQGLRLTGAKGTLLAGFHRFSPRDFRHNWIRVRTKERRRFIPVLDDLFVPGGVYETLSHCIDALQHGAALVSSPAQALKDVAVVEAMLKSSKLKRSTKPVTLPRLVHTPLLKGRTQTLKAYGDFLSYQPRRVVECASVEDVSDAVAAAARSGLKVGAFGNGYSQGPEILVDDVAIRLGGLNRVQKLDSGHEYGRCGGRRPHRRPNAFSRRIRPFTTVVAFPDAMFDRSRRGDRHPWHKSPMGHGFGSRAVLDHGHWVRRSEEDQFKQHTGREARGRHWRLGGSSS